MAADDDYVDPVIEAYKPGVDQTLIIEQLRRTPTERLQDAMKLQRTIAELRGVALKQRRDE